MTTPQLLIILWGQLTRHRDRIGWIYHRATGRCMGELYEICPALHLLRDDTGTVSALDMYETDDILNDCELSDESPAEREQAARDDIALDACGDLYE